MYKTRKVNVRRRNGERGVKERRFLREDAKKLALTPADRKILRCLLVSNGETSPKAIAKMTGIPATTVQRRRKMMFEMGILSLEYALAVNRFGWRRVDFLISTYNGKTTEVAQKLVAQPEVTFVQKTIGQHTIDIKTEAVIRDNSNLLLFLERVRAFDGVREVMWSEAVENIGKKISVPIGIIDKL